MRGRNHVVMGRIFSFRTGNRCDGPCWIAYLRQEDSLRDQRAIAQCVGPNGLNQQPRHRNLGASAEPPRFLAVSIEERAAVESNVCQFPTGVLDVVVVCLCGYPDIWRARNRNLYQRRGPEKGTGS